MYVVKRREKDLNVAEHRDKINKVISCYEEGTAIVTNKNISKSFSEKIVIRAIRSPLFLHGGLF